MQHVTAALAKHGVVHKHTLHPYSTGLDEHLQPLVRLVSASLEWILATKASSGGADQFQSAPLAQQIQFVISIDTDSVEPTDCLSQWHPHVAVLRTSMLQSKRLPHEYVLPSLPCLQPHPQEQPSTVTCSVMSPSPGKSSDKQPTLPSSTKECSLQLPFDPLVLAPDARPRVTFSGYVGAKPERIALCAELLRHPTSLDLDVCMHTTFWCHMTPEQRLTSRAQMMLGIRNSVFVLAPNGTGNFSHRLYEVLRAGRIPVIVGEDYALPLEPTLDWTEFAVVLKSWSPTAVLPAIQAFMATHDLAVAQRRAAQVSSEYLSDGTFMDQWLVTLR